MEKSVLGIHHITAITDDPQRNIDFYVGILVPHLANNPPLVLY